MALLDRQSGRPSGSAHRTFEAGPLVMAQTIDSVLEADRSADSGGPTVCTLTGNVLVAWLRIDARESFGKSAGLNPEEVKQRSDAALVLEAYRTCGVEFLKHLTGDFALALWDRSARKLILARDPLGVRPLFYSQSCEQVAFASSAALFRGLRGVDCTPDPGWLTLYLSGRSKSLRKTGLTGVLKLPPGHYLEVADDSINLLRYHHFHNNPPWHVTRTDTAVDRYRTSLFEAVRRRAQGSLPFAAETSGGLDSTSVIAALANVSPASTGDSHLFGFAHLAEEAKMILAVGQFCGFHWNHIHTSPSLDYNQWLQDELLGARLVGYPIEVALAVRHIPFYSLARDFSIGTLFSGFGGDECVSNQAHQLREELVAHGELLAAFRESTGFRSALSTLCNRHTSVRSGHIQSIAASVEASVRDSIVTREAAHAVRLREVSLEQSLVFAGSSTINASVLKLLEGPSLSVRMEQCALVAKSFGLEYQWPLVDADLVQTYLSSPAIEKRRRNVGRYLHRRAMAPYTPEQVIWKRRKEMGPIVIRNHSKEAWRKQISASLREVSTARPIALKGIVDFGALERVANAMDGGLRPQVSGLTRRNATRTLVVLDWLESL